MATKDPQEYNQVSGDGPPDAKALLLELIHRLEILIKDCNGLRMDFESGHPPCGHMQHAIAKIRTAGCEVSDAMAIITGSQSDAKRRSSLVALPSNHVHLNADQRRNDDDKLSDNSGKTAHRVRVVSALRQRTYRWKRMLQGAEVWSTFDTARSSDFFHEILIARDGGFSEVDQLWDPWRWVSAIFFVLCVCSNLYAIISSDLRIILKGGRAYDDTIFLSSTIMWGLSILVHADDDTYFNGSVTVCVAELLGLGLILGRVMVYACQARVARDEWSRWRAIEKISWMAMPELCAYSGMRLLHFVSPTVFVADFLKFVGYSQTRWTTNGLIFCKWGKFVITRFLCFVIGLDSLLVKVHSAHAAFDSQDGSLSLERVYTLVTFVVQIMGIVQLYKVVMQRLFVFIFGGENGMLSTHEKSLMAVWKAMLAREIWKEYSFAKFAVIMLTFSDLDFQKLVLNQRNLSFGESDASESEDGSADGTDSDELDEWVVG